MITGPNPSPNAVWRVYKTSISNGEWKLWREGQPFNQRCTATICAGQQGHKRPPSSEALPASHSALPPDLGRWEKTGLSVHGSATMRSRASAASVEGTVNSSRKCVMAFIMRHRISVFFVLAYGLTWGATSWNGLFAPGVLLAAQIVVTLAEGLSGLKAPARNASPTATPSHS
jgi:hypothetical protein